MIKKLFLDIYFLTLIFYSCNYQTINDKGNNCKKVNANDTTNYKGLQGTWARYNNIGFTLIEINDTSNVLYYQFIDRKADIDTISSDRYWYYKSKATMGYWDRTTIWISTDKFRFDYKIKNDTLVEFDKMGDQGKFIKVYTDEQKWFKDFNSANLKGSITYVAKVAPSEFFALNNINWEFSFTSIVNNTNVNKTFSDIAAIGDSVIKPAYSDTLILYKKDIKQYFKFTFVRR